jgi:hypothetical protein
VRRRALSIVCVIVAAFVCESASAADLPPAQAYNEPVAAAAKIYNWTGIYIGLNGGYGFGQVTPMSRPSPDVPQSNVRPRVGLTTKARYWTRVQ